MATDLGLPAFGRGKQYAGDDIEVSFDGRRCRHFAECVRGLPDVFDAGRRPWIDPSAGTADEIAEVIRRCPSGALQYRRREGVDELGDEVTTLELLPTGQMLLRGRLSVRDPDTGGVQLETRMIACGCGASGLAPYCDGACVAVPDSGS